MEIKKSEPKIEFKLRTINLEIRVPEKIIDFKHAATKKEFKGAHPWR